MKPRKRISLSAERRKQANSYQLDTRPRAFSASLPCLFTLLGLAAAAVDARAEQIYGFTTANQLFTVEITTGARANIGTFSGSIWPAKRIAGIEYRPSNGKVCALGYEPIDQSIIGRLQLYTVDLATAALTPVGTRFGFRSTDNVNFNPADAISIDIDPTEDRLRTASAFLSAQPESFRIDPDAGARAPWMRIGLET